MPRFEIDVQGKMYEVEAPDMQTALKALARGGPQEPPAVTEAAPATPTDPMDVPKSAGAGLIQGASYLAGLPGDLLGLVDTGVRKSAEALGIPPPGERTSIGRAAQAIEPPSSAAITSTIEKGIGPLHKPQTTAGKYARTIGEFAPGALAGPGGIARRALTNVAVPGAASEAAGQATEGTAAEPYARMAGAVAGGFAPAVGRRAITPLPNSAERQAMVNTLAQEGVQPTAGMTSGRDRLKAFEQEFGGHAFQRAQSRTSDQFTRAVLRRAGINADRATPQVMDRAFTNIGNEFDNMAAGTTIRADARMWQDVQRAARDYQLSHGAPAPAVQEAVQRIVNVATQNRGRIPGEAYRSIRSDVNRWQRQADPGTAGALRDVMEGLDDAVQRSMSPQNRAQWQDVRRRYRNMLVVERAVSGAGENAAMGGISPQMLRAADVGQNRRAYVRGRSAYSDLAHAGNSLMTMPPRSGTPERLAVRGTMGAIGATLGGTMGADEALKGAMMGLAAPYAVGRTTLSRPVQSYLRNQRAMPPQTNEELQRALLLGTLVGPRMLGPPPPSQP